MGRIRVDGLKIGADFCDDIDTLCKKCKNLKSECVCINDFLEVKGRDSYFLWVNMIKRKGKEITICGIFYEEKEGMQEILKNLKKNLACGGNLIKEEKGYVLELQGEHREKLKRFLKNLNFCFKK